MIAQGIVIQENKVLMVRQFVERGDIVWNFPGGGIEADESPEQACIRVKEETGFDIQITKLIHVKNEKYSFLAKIIGGELFLDSEKPYNEEILEVAWIDLDSHEKFDSFTRPILDLFWRKLSNETNSQKKSEPLQARFFRI